jgi:enoyl-CoA hydratase
LIKESVNQTQDAQGFYTALNACFSIHQMNHAHWAEMTKGEAAIATPEFGGNRAAPIRPSDPRSAGVPALR